MKTARPAVTAITTGTRIVYDGEAWTVTGIEAGRLLLRSARGKSLLADTATVLASPSAVLPAAGGDGEPAACGQLLGSLPAAGRGELAVRLRHLREALTGYACGTPAAAEPGEPRPEFDPSLPLLDRYQAKSAELGVSMRTLQRWVASLQESGPAGVADGRSQRAADPLGGVDERWLAMCRLVLAEHTEASRPTRELMLRRVSARLAAGHGEGTVPEPGRRRAGAVLAELTRGTNAFTGSTKGKRSIAARPQGVYGRLRPARPGEFLLLDTTPLDVFAMEPVTLRWVRCELTIAMDLYSRCITGLRLSPASTKSVDAALVLFEALRPGSRQHTSGGLLPYAGLPDLVAVGDGTAGLAGVAAETIVVDHGKIYLSDHLLSVCQRLGISVQPARPLTPTDKAAIERFFRTLSEGLLAALPGYKGPDVYSRGADPEGCAYFFTGELEQVIREWISGIYHCRPHAGLADPQVPGLGLSPEEMFAHGTARAGRLKVPAHLAEALGIPGRQDHQAAPAGPPAAQLAAICAATGLAPPAVTAMLAAGPSPPTPLILAWAPQHATRFCPACLAEDPGQMPAAWSLPVTFFCLRHGRLLASRCPHCDRPPASRPLPSRAGHCGGPDGCGTRLDTAGPSRHDGTPAARRAQQAISGFLAGLRDPAGTASRRHALGQLTDITLTAYHLAAHRSPQRRPGRRSPQHAGCGRPHRGVHAAHRPPRQQRARPAGQPGHRHPAGHCPPGHPVIMAAGQPGAGQPDRPRP